MDQEEHGDTLGEFERGEDRAWHLSMWGCLVLASLAALATYSLYHLAIRQGSAWSISW
jgi:hypothetical protein